MDAKERIAFLEASLSRQIQWIAGADTRIPLVLGIDTAMLGVLAASLEEQKAWSVVAIIAAVLAALAILASIASLTMAAVPRTNGPSHSMIFFGGISRRDIAQFRTDIDQLTWDSLTDDLCNQVHRNAEIASEKFKWVSRSIAALIIATVPWAIALYLAPQLGGQS